jgi:hypothetical protein
MKLKCPHRSFVIFCVHTYDYINFVFLFVQFAYVLHVSVGLPRYNADTNVKKARKVATVYPRDFLSDIHVKIMKIVLYIRAWYKVPLSINLQVILCKNICIIWRKRDNDICDARCKRTLNICNNLIMNNTNSNSKTNEKEVIYKKI